MKDLLLKQLETAKKLAQGARTQRETDFANGAIFGLQSVLDLEEENNKTKGA
jgi:hypothetical protein